MAPLFRARRPAEEGGSGGKILRGRRGGSASQSSPYARPSPPALPPPPPRAGSPRWLLGLVSGAGKLISSVFRSDSSSSASSSDYSSDEDCIPRNDEEEDTEARADLHGLNQGVKELVTDCMEESHAIVTISETKLAIEKLLAQETFSRDECNRLIKLIQSRVVDSPEFVHDGAERGVTNKGAGNAVDPSRAWLSLKQNMDLPESLQCSPVMEAKKWLEEKKLSSNSKVDSVCGPCTLNTDMLNYDIHNNKDVSPVDLAKSYMQSLPPWQSPRFGSSGLKAPTPSRVDFCMVENNDATTSHSLPPFKDFKRNYLSARLLKSSDNNRRVRLKLTENMLEHHEFKQFDAQQNIFQNETLKISSAMDERGEGVLGTEHYSCSLQYAETSSAPKSLADLHVKDDCSKDGLSLPDKAVNADPLALADKPSSIVIASEPKETDKATESANETALPTISTLGPTESKIESEPTLSPGLEENKDVVEPLLTEQEDIVDSDTPHGSFVPASTSVVHGGDPMAEKAVLAPDLTKSSKLSDADDVNNIDKNVQTLSANTTAVVGNLEADNTTESNPDAKPQDGNIFSQHGTDGLANELSTNGGSAESNADPQSFCEEDQSYTHCSNGEQTMGGISGGTCELQCEVAIDTAAIHGASSITGQNSFITDVTIIFFVVWKLLLNSAGHVDFFLAGISRRSTIGLEAIAERPSQGIELHSPAIPIVCCSLFQGLTRQLHRQAHETLRRTRPGPPLPGCVPLH
ncbi:hypothetical protein OPV22_006407 [Ensete ventricosum]|uniref:Protein WAVE n=1 Tax=Ensete ventricosum TaxID=4639 RepID=A0AAV8RKS3_ENSVE|nr:hypothetical protein OPV22_006407 [Ensete ventricosum]